MLFSSCTDLSPPHNFILDPPLADSSLLHGPLSLNANGPVVFVYPFSLYLIFYFPRTFPSKQQRTATGSVPTLNLLKAALDRATVQMPDKLKWMSDVAL